jgi:hypothetical protein
VAVRFVDADDGSDDFTFWAPVRPIMGSGRRRGRRRRAQGAAVRAAAAVG